MKKALDKFMMETVDYELVLSGLLTLIAFILLDGRGISPKLFEAHGYPTYDILTLLMTFPSAFLGICGTMVGGRIKNGKIIQTALTFLSFSTLLNVFINMMDLSGLTSTDIAILYFLTVFGTIIYSVLFYKGMGLLKKTWLFFRKKKVKTEAKEKKKTMDYPVDLVDEDEINELFQICCKSIEEIKRKENIDVETDIFVENIEKKIMKLNHTYRNISIGNRHKIRKDTIELLKICIDKIKKVEQEEDEYLIREIQTLKRLMEN